MVCEADKNSTWNSSFKDSSFTIFRPSVIYLCSSSFFVLGFFICWVSSSLSDRFSFFFFVLRQQIWRPDYASSNRLFVLPLQIISCLFSIFKSFFLRSSSDLMFFKYKIESLRLEIYVALYSQTKWESSL